MNDQDNCHKDDGQKQTVGVFANPRDTFNPEDLKDHLRKVKPDEATYVHDWVIYKCKCGKTQMTITLWSTTPPCPDCLRRYRSTLRKGIIKILPFKKYSLWIRQLVRWYLKWRAV